MSKAIILTGASRGIGLAAAEFLLDQGHKVVLIARSEQPLREVEKKYGADKVAILAADLSDFSIATKAVEIALAKFSRLDGLVVNHGTLDPVKRVKDSTADEWRKAFDINLISGVALVQACLPQLRECKGRIIFVSSGAAISYRSTWAAYGATKAAMNHFARTLAKEEKEVTTIALRPGVVDTALVNDVRTKHNNSMDAEDVARFEKLAASGELLKPEQPGYVLAQLALEAPNELSGQFVSWNSEELKDFQESK